MSRALDDIDFTDPEVVECPYPTYARLRAQAPVWFDAGAGHYVITRYEDVRAILLDAERFSSRRPTMALSDGVRGSDKADDIQALYEREGWLPAQTLSRRDDPDHKAVRQLYDYAFRASKIRLLDGFIEQVAHELIDEFVEEGRCEFVRAYAVPLPLITIAKQMGAPRTDIWRIKAWTDAWVKRIGGIQTDEERFDSVRMEIEAQHYFQSIFERLRREPDDTLLSDLVNREVEGWGRTLNDNELHAEMMADTFVGGAETTTNAISEGLRLVIENPEIWRRLKSDPDAYLPGFTEEAIRLASPVQGLFRTATTDVEIAGVAIPAGSVLNVRFGSANYDESKFPCPADVDLERKAPRSHVAFGAGVHHCLGAPLARREVTIGFTALLERIDEFSFPAVRTELRYQPSLILRGLQELPVEVTAKSVP